MDGFITMFHSKNNNNEEEQKEVLKKKKNGRTRMAPPRLDLCPSGGLMMKLILLVFLSAFDFSLSFQLSSMTLAKSKNIKRTTNVISSSCTRNSPARSLNKKKHGGTSNSNSNSSSSSISISSVSCCSTKNSNTSSNYEVEDKISSSSSLDPEKEEYLDALLKEALFRMLFFMETDYLLRVQNCELQSLFQTCVDSVYIDQSTIPQAGRGLFAKRDIPKGTIIAFYPVDSMGLKFESGLCNSIQLAKNQEDMIDVQSSSYALFSLSNRKLCGVDLQKEFDNGRLFVDMNPLKHINQGWYCGLINDAAVVRYQGDTEYYPNSRMKQNIEIVPFSTAPFQVGVTIKDVKADEELFVSYGYGYWVNKLILDSNNETNDENTAMEWEEKPIQIAEQENEALDEMFATLDNVEERYKESSWILSQLFNGMNSEQPPPIVPPSYLKARMMMEGMEHSKKEKEGWLLLLSRIFRNLGNFLRINS